MDSDKDKSLLSSESDEDRSSTTSSDIEWPSEDDLEPLPTEEQAEEYIQEIQRQEDEEQQLTERFNENQDIKTWCKCSQCNLQFIVKHEECSCCLEYDRCREKLEALGEDIQPRCITLLEAFKDICLKTWVLEVAAVGLRTRKNVLYTSLRQQGRKSNSEFYRAVSYRQYTRFIFDYVGNSRRLALPCCVYNAIRKAFPEESKNLYRGFEEEADDELEQDSDNEDDDVQQFIDASEASIDDP